MILKKGLFALTITCFLLTTAFAQDAEPTSVKTPKGRPDIPGSFVLELGINRGLNMPDTMKLGGWGSRTVNIFYQGDYQIGKSKFSFHPGLGLGLERYKMKNFYTLNNTPEGSELVKGFVGIKKSMIVANYIDLPLELRFTTHPSDPGRSFRFSVGGRVSYLFDSFTKIKYREDGETKKVKDKQNFGLSDFRYGVFTKIGAGNFALFGYYNLSPFFKSDKGPQKTEMNTFTVGISLSSF